MPPEDWSEEEVYGADPDADLEYWSKVAYWTVEEATALSYGKEPRVVNWEFLRAIPDHPFATDYAKRRDLGLRAKTVGHLTERNAPIHYIEWAKSVDIPFCSKLEEVVRARGRSKSVSHKESAETTARNSLLRIILGMAIRGYGYDPHAKKSDVTKEIADDVRATGLPMDEATVLKGLRAAKDEYGHRLTKAD